MQAYYKFPGSRKIAIKYRTTLHLKHYYIDAETGEPLEPLDTVIITLLGNTYLMGLMRHRN